MAIGRFAQVSAEGVVSAICMTDISDSQISEGHYDRDNNIRFITAPEGVPDVEVMESYRYVDDEWVSIGPRPSSVHIWDKESSEWVLDLTGAKAAKNVSINMARLEANHSHFMFLGKKIAADQLSRSDIDAVHGIVVLTNEMPDGWPGAWKTMDNSYVLLPDKLTWTLFYKAMVGQGSSNFAHSQVLKARLATARTIEEVDAIVWQPQ
jgi:hypothetical protein